MPLVSCPDCNKEISDSAENCPNCGKPMSTQIRCTNCKSTHVEKISTANKAGSVLMFGVFAAGKVTKTWQCLDCKFKW